MEQLIVGRSEGVSDCAEVVVETARKSPSSRTKTPIAADCGLYAANHGRRLIL